MEWIPENPSSDEVWRFLLLHEREFGPPPAEYIQKVLVDHGGVLAARQDNELVGVLGYTYGEPSAAFVNKDIFYIYYLLIANAHRNSVQGIKSLLRALISILYSAHALEIRFKAIASNQRANRFYGRIGKRLYEESNDAGEVCNLYATTLDNLARLV